LQSGVNRRGSASGDKSCQASYSEDLKILKKKLIKKRLTIGLSEPDIEKLEAYCKVTGRNYSDVIRECIRKLKLLSGC
jgi:predicted DNA binding CopG/RHH family protein